MLKKEQMEAVNYEPSPKQERGEEIISVQDSKEEVHIRLDKLLELQRIKGQNSYRNSISRVPSHMYNKNIDEKHVFEPQVISIGPYHRGKDHLKPMEEIKLLYLNQLLKRAGEVSVQRLTDELKKKEQMARECYAASVDHVRQDEFVEMMLLDGCFIVEVFRNVRVWELRNSHPLTSFTLERVKRDLVLLENQLPFFVLSDLFHWTKAVVSDGDKTLTIMATEFFSRTNPGFGKHSNPNLDAKHLLGLLHDIWFTSSVRDHIPVATYVSYWHGRGGDAVKDGLKNWCRRVKRKFRLSLIPSATQLKAAGIQFMVNDKYSTLDDWFAVKFVKGVLHVPQLRVRDDTDSIFLNLVAYEQSCEDITSMPATCYIAIMDCLINTEADVELLNQAKIILNNFGDLEEIASLINRLGRSLLFGDFHDFPHFDMLDEVDKHYNKRRHRWMASLRLDYFNSPWAWISFLAAVVLLVLTVIQTVYTVKS